MIICTLFGFLMGWTGRVMLTQYRALQKKRQKYTILEQFLIEHG